MDVEKPEIKKGDQLPLEDDVYRIVLVTDRDKSNKQIPAVRCFTLTEVDKKCGFGLSVDWSQKTTPEEAISRIGLSYKTTTEVYKDHSKREIYSLNVGFLSKLDNIKEIVYDPVYNVPAERGRPDNPSHSQAFFKPEDYDQYEPQICMEIREHAKNNRISFNRVCKLNCVKE